MAKAKQSAEEIDPFEAALAEVEKSFGKGTIMRLGDAPIEKIQVFPTGILTLDAALGIGGVPRGRIVEIYGPEMSGKSTLALHVVAAAQKSGERVVYIDVEHAMDLGYASAVGVDVGGLYFSQPSCGEDALTIVETMVSSGKVGVVVVDSVAALVPRAELEGEMGDSHMGLQARLMSQALRKLNGVVSETNTCLIFINQIREKLAVTWGSNETTTGGRALKFYASVRIETRKAAPIKDGDKIVGGKTNVKIVKNKCAPPFKTCELDIYYGQGFSADVALLDKATEIGVIELAGAWYSMGETRIGQGRAGALAFLTANPEKRTEIETMVRETLFSK